MRSESICIAVTRPITRRAVAARCRWWRCGRKGHRRQTAVQQPQPGSLTRDEASSVAALAPPKTAPTRSPAPVRAAMAKVA